MDRIPTFDLGGGGSMLLLCQWVALAAASREGQTDALMRNPAVKGCTTCLDQTCAEDTAQDISHHCSLLL
jgi:hypothetical protein